MKVWLKIQSVNRPFYKQTIIHDTDDILNFIRYLCNQPSLNPPVPSYPSPVKPSMNTPKQHQTNLITPRSNKKEAQQTHQTPSSSPNNENMISVTDEEGNNSRVNMLKIFPSGNLSAILFPKKSKSDKNTTFPKAQFIQNSLGRQKSQILTESKKIPLHKFINHANIINSILWFSRQKQTSSSQKRSNILSLNDKFYFELINQDVLCRMVDQNTVKSANFQNEFKQLYEYFNKKIQQLLMDKDLFHVTLDVISSKFISGKSSQNSNSKSMKQDIPITNQKYLYALFNYLEKNQSRFWPYEYLSLMSILKLYEIFFDQIQFKLSFFIDQQSQIINKIEVIPFFRLSQRSLGRDFQSVMYSNNQDSSDNFKFKGQIFRILMNSKVQTKKYSHIPIMKCKFSGFYTQPKITLQDLIEMMSIIGFKMNEINSILRIFSLILNLGLIQLEQQSYFKEQGHRFYLKIVDNEAIKNITLLYGNHIQSIRSIILGATDYRGCSEQSIQLTSIKKQVFMRILWEQAISKIATDINAKVQNVSKDFDKLKRFEIFCHHNAFFNEQKLNEEVFIEDNSIQYFEYLMVGKKIAQKQFMVQQQVNHETQSNQTRKNKNPSEADTSVQFQKVLQKSYLTNLESEYTSFNAKIISQQRLFNQIYTETKLMIETKCIVKDIFNSNNIQDPSSRYFKQFYAQQKSVRLTEHNYLFCTDYWNFIHQEKEGVNVMNFFIKLLKQTIDDTNNQTTMHHLPQPDVKQETYQSPRQIKLTPTGRNSSKKLQSSIQQKHLFKSPSKYKKKVLTIADPQVPQVEYSILSLMKSPKRSVIQIELLNFIKKYLYGQELKKINQFFKNINGQSNYPKFSIQNVYQTMQNNVIDLHVLKNQNEKEPIPKSLQSLSQSQVDEAKQLLEFNIHYDDMKQFFYLQAPQSLFNTIQLQNDLQKQSVFKIINLFRRFKFRRNNKEHALKRRLLNLTKLVFNFAESRYFQKLGESFDRFNLKSNNNGTPTIKTGKKSMKSRSPYTLKELPTKRIIQVLQKLCRNTTQNAFRTMTTNQYDLIVTSPSGMRKNLDDLSIDVRNVNTTAAIHPGNTSTSNVKNLLSSNQRKGFSRVTVSFNQGKFNKTTEQSQRKSIYPSQDYQIKSTQSPSKAQNKVSITDNNTINLKKIDKKQQSQKSQTKYNSETNKTEKKTESQKIDSKGQNKEQQKLILPQIDQTKSQSIKSTNEEDNKIVKPSSNFWGSTKQQPSSIKQAQKNNQKHVQKIQGKIESDKSQTNIVKVQDKNKPELLESNNFPSQRFPQLKQKSLQQSKIQPEKQQKQSIDVNKKQQNKIEPEILWKKSQDGLKPSQAKEKKQQIVHQKPLNNQVLNDIVSVVNSVLSGSMVSFKSEAGNKILKQELFQIKDAPFFSFESWGKDVGAKFPEKQNKSCSILFRKYEEEKMRVNEQAVKQIEQDRAIKQKIINSSFVNYLKQNLNLTNNQPVQNVFYFQKKNLQKPLLKHYDIKVHGQAYKDMFNCILKISLFKNTSKRLFELLNIMIKPIKEAYIKQKKSKQAVFQDQPLMNASYELDYNVLRDELFLQLAKQLMGNQDSDSTVSLIFAMEIIVKNYYPSTKLFYPYLNHLKTNHLNKPELFEKVYENLLKFSQAIQGYKGSKVKIYKDESIPMTQAQHNAYLQIRSSMFYNEQCQLKQLGIKIQLFNKERFEFKVGNETLKTTKKRFLNELGFLAQQRNFALYQQRGFGNFSIIDQTQKTVDYLSKFYNQQIKYVVQLRVKHYYPIKFKDINSLRMFYLNMIGEEVRMPFKQDDYEHLVALSISFNEFEEDRIANYIVITRKEKLLDNDLVSIKHKLQEMAKTDNDKKICQFEYFKIMKEFNFLLAKVYKVVKEKQYYFQEVDRIVIKPKELCMYGGTSLKSSISLFRIKSFYFQNNEIHIDFIYSDRDLGDAYDKKFHGTVKNLIIKDVYKINELYEDIVYYTQMLHFGIKS